MTTNQRRLTREEKAEYDWLVKRYKYLTGKQRIHGTVRGCPDGWKYCANPAHYREEREQQNELDIDENIPMAGP